MNYCLLFGFLVPLVLEHVKGWWEPIKNTRAVILGDLQVTNKAITEYNWTIKSQGLCGFSSCVLILCNNTSNREVCFSSTTFNSPWVKWKVFRVFCAAVFGTSNAQTCWLYWPEKGEDMHSCNFSCFAVIRKMSSFLCLQLLFGDDLWWMLPVPLSLLIVLLGKAGLYCNLAQAQFIFLGLVETVCGHCRTLIPSSLNHLCFKRCLLKGYL